ncbi:hypothetical protein E2562_018583 [Oryza meyeriana var. granulata]|uniref:Uncharacterized protein n=1 Tax=Oryza meyeriana var. granulata TaxID=110450 RepID=A0A6G1F9H8_9ORYZ|nr:hypothetical protein E2562_018583 [Oryza meyeriana var. granulata]
MAIACAVSVAAPPLTAKRNTNSAPRRSFRQRSERRSHPRGVTARFSGNPADADADRKADSGRIEVSGRLVTCALQLFSRLVKLLRGELVASTPVRLPSTRCSAYRGVE